jgi:hypothetical protein
MKTSSFMTFFEIATFCFAIGFVLFPSWFYISGDQKFLFSAGFCGLSILAGEFRKLKDNLK